MVRNNKKQIPILTLEFESFKLIGVSSKENQKWYEFSIYNKDFIFKNAGGESIFNLIENIIEIHSNPKNIYIKDFKENEYLLKDFGSLETLYLGYIVISGYTTFGFFKNQNYIYIRITYNNKFHNIQEPYQLVKIPEKVFEQWCEYLLKFKNDVSTLFNTQKD